MSDGPITVERLHDQLAIIEREYDKERGIRWAVHKVGDLAQGWAEVEHLSKQVDRIDRERELEKTAAAAVAADRAQLGKYAVWIFWLLSGTMSVIVAIAGLIYRNLDTIAAAAQAARAK